MHQSVYVLSDEYLLLRRTGYFLLLLICAATAVDRVQTPCYNIFDNLITHCVAHPASEPDVLNKITGCESRTVPPLYVLTGRIKGESRSLGEPGKAILSAEEILLGMSQKTYALVSPHPCVNMGVCCRRKTAAVLFFRHRSLFAF